MLVSDIVRRNARYFPDRDAVAAPGRPTTTWAGLEERTNRLARAFLDLGLEKGDRIAAFAPNCPEYIEFYFACAKSGVIGAPLNIRLSPNELASYLAYVEPKIILAHATVADAAQKLAVEVPSEVRVVGFGGAHGADIDLETVVDSQRSSDPGCSVDELDTYQLGATSGTTGIPKAAILTHRNAITSMLSWLAELPTTECDTNLQCIPMFFNPGGTASLHPSLTKGGRTVILQGFDPSTFLRAAREFKANHSILVPTMVQMITDHPDAATADLSSMRSIIIGGAPLPRELFARAKRVLGNVFFPAYGMAETYSCGFVLRRESQFLEGTDDQVRRLNSAGKPNVLMQVRVVGDDGNDVPGDNATSGEVWLRGPNVSPGYFRMEDETTLCREGEWFKSGDIAVVDDERYVTIVDRKKDMIITGGINVFSREVEEVLYRHPAVAQAAVIGIPHEKWGEAIHAVVTLKSASDATPEDIMSFCSALLTRYKRPRSVEIVEALPISGTGKILKRDLRAKYWEGRERAI